ncbi:MAG: DNA-binding protein [Candidatus Nanohaloarchaea archaeon]
MNQSEDIEDLREEKLEELQDQEDQEEERRSQVKEAAKEYLTSEAQSRLENVRTARPEQASSIERQIAQLGMSGRIQGKIDDSELKTMLKKLNEKGSDYKIRHR